MINELGTIVSRIDHQFYLPPDIVASLDKYYILHWQGSHLIKEITNSNQLGSYPEGILEHQGTKYRVRFLANLTAWHIVNNPNVQYKLSFRKLHDKKTGFVLVKKA